MDGAIATAYVEVRPATEGFGAKLDDDVLPAAEKTGRSAAQKIGDAIVAYGVGRAIAASLSEADEAQRIGAQTEAVIRSTGAAAAVSAEQVGTLTEALSEKAAIDDELIQSGANVLLTFTRIRNEAGAGNDIFNQATTAALDLSVALGQDMTSAATLVGKALNDPIAGLSALGRAGVQFTDDQKTQIRTLVETGDVLGAQRIILGELQTQFEGSAEAQATAMGRLQVISGNFKETIGGALLPIVEQAAPVVGALADAFAALPGPIQAVVVAGGGIAAIARPINEATTLARGLGGAMRNAEGGVSALGKAGIALAAVGIAATLYEIAQASNDVGVDIDKFTNATEAQFQDLIEKLRPIFENWTDAAKQIADQMAEGNVEAAERFADALDDAGISSEYLRQRIEEKRRSDIQAAADQRTHSEAVDEGAESLLNLGGSAEGAGYSVGIYRGSILEAKDTTELFRDALDQARDKVDELFGRLSETEEVEAAFRDLIRSAIDESDRLRDSDTDRFERHDAFQQLLIDTRDTALDLAGSLGRDGVGADEIRTRVQGLIDQAADMGDRYGLSRDEVNELRDALGLLPDQVDLVLNTNLLQELEYARALQLLLSPEGGIVVPGPGGGSRAEGFTGPTVGGFSVGSMTIIAPDPVSAGESAVREMRRESLLAGGRG